MIPYAFLAFILAGTSYAAYLDLKTSEVPDWISLLVAGGSVLYYLFHSLTLPLTTVDFLLLAGTVAFTAAVVTYLKLYRAIPERFHGDCIGELLEGERFSIDRSDVAGTLLMFTSGGLYLAAVLQGGMQPVVLSVGIGTAMFALGWSMYILGMWGGADAFMLGVVGYALPVLPETVTPMYELALPAPLALLVTVFLVGAVYSMVYAVIVAVRHENAINEFRKEVWDSRNRVLMLSTAVFAAIFIAGFFVSRSLDIPLQFALWNAVIFTVMFIVLVVIYRFLKVVEQHVMRRTIPVEELQPGDVLAEDMEELEEPLDASRIIGVTPEQVQQVREAYDTVDVRTGVRFIVAFPVAILILLTLGDPLKAIVMVM